jgi:hypothetical protein
MSRRKTGTKGQLEGYAITSKTGKLWVAGTDRKTWNAAGQNNSNPTPYAASVANGEWELILVNSSHYCLIYLLKPTSCLPSFDRDRLSRERIFCTVIARSHTIA